MEHSRRCCCKKIMCKKKGKPSIDRLTCCLANQTSRKRSYAPCTLRACRSRQRDCSAHRNQCRVHSLWTKHPSFCSFQRACVVTIFQLRRVDKFSLAAAGRPQAASTQPIERYGFAGFRVLVRSFHASTLSLVLIHAAGITKQHMFALLQQAFEQLVREEYELDTRYAVCANVLSNYVFSDTATRRPGTKH